MLKDFRILRLSLLGSGKQRADGVSVCMAIVSARGSVATQALASLEARYSGPREVCPGDT